MARINSAVITKRFQRIVLSCSTTKKGLEPKGLKKLLPCDFALNSISINLLHIFSLQKFWEWNIYGHFVHLHENGIRK